MIDLRFVGWLVAGAALCLSLLDVGLLRNWRWALWSRTVFAFVRTLALGGWMLEQPVLSLFATAAFNFAFFWLGLLRIVGRRCAPN